MKIWVIYDSKYGNNELVAKAIEGALRGDPEVHLAPTKKVTPKKVMATSPDALFFGGPLRFTLVSFAIKRWVSKFAKLLTARGIKLKKVAAWGTHLRDLPNQLSRFTWAHIVETQWRILRDLVPADDDVARILGIVIENVKGPWNLVGRKK